jgi:pSer/pThr/pTyr-binding forkhead associated (FHA) protein
VAQINLTFKDNFIATFPVSDGVTVGSDPSSDIHIDSLAIEPHHAKISERDGEFTITTLGDTASMLINGQKASSQQLKNSDHIQVGKHTLEFIHQAVAPHSEPADQEEPEEIAVITSMKKKEAFLQVLNGHNMGKTISLTRNLTNLGKPGVQTAVIARRENGFYLSHLEGENSPTVNNRAIGDISYELSSGDAIQIGNIKLLFSLS